MGSGALSILLHLVYSLPVAGRVWGAQQSFVKDPLTEWRWVRLVASLLAQSVEESACNAAAASCFRRV